MKNADDYLVHILEESTKFQMNKVEMANNLLLAAATVMVDIVSPDVDPAAVIKEGNQVLLDHFIRALHAKGSA
jgi:hypothetical protein